MKLNLQILILIFIFLALQEKSFPVARPVKNVSHVVTIKKDMTDSDCFSLPKEIVAVERIGRKLRGERKKLVSQYSVGKRKGEEEEDNSIMAFSSDYHPPKPHPPKNN